MFLRSGPQTVEIMLLISRTYYNIMHMHLDDVVGLHALACKSVTNTTHCKYVCMYVLVRSLVVMLIQEMSGEGKAHS